MHSAQPLPAASTDGPEPAAFSAPGVDALQALESLVLGTPSATATSGSPVLVGAASAWEPGLEQEALNLLNSGRTDVWDVLTRRFETRLIQTALASTRGRRIEAAHKLGIGRNTITRKIQELHLEE